MILRRFKLDVMTLSFGGLLLLLIGAAIFMHRAINRASAAEHREKQEQLFAALQNSQKDFAALLRTLPDVSGTTQNRSANNLPAWVSAQTQRWRSTTSHPNLLRNIYVGTLLPSANTQFTRLYFAPETNQTASLVTATESWLPVFSTWREDLRTRAQNKMLQPFAPDAVAYWQTENRFFVVVPLTIKITAPAPAPPKPMAVPKVQLPRLGPPRNDRNRQTPPPFGPPPFADEQFGRRRPAPPEFVLRQREEARKRAEASVQKQLEKIEANLRKEQFRAAQRVPAAPPLELLGGFCWFELDEKFLQQQFFPQILQQHFSATELTNYHLAAVIEPAQTIFFTTNAAINFAAPEAQQILFPLEAKSWRGALPAATQPLAQHLSLRAQHKNGTLHAALDRTRWRNLALGYGLLFLLFASAASLLIAAQRVRTLAAQQMQFVAGVTHELRTPLTAIQAAGFNLASGRVTDTERVRQYGTMIHTEGRRLADMIEQTLRYAGAQSKQSALSLQPVQLDEIIERALGAYQADFAAANWHIEKNIPADLPRVNGDAQALENALKNLLQNALKYAADGKWLGITASTENTTVKIAITDRGAGIDAQDLPHIFEPFYRARAMVGSTVPGTGLGLSLVKQYVQAHNGRITVKANAEGGTTFTIYLPGLTDNAQA